MRLFFTITAFLFSFSLFSQTVFVKSGATGSGNSWSNATGNLMAALDNAVYGDVIWVATGTYKPTTCNVCDENDREQRFSIKDGVTLIGGFAGTESNLNQRVLNSNTETILSGDINGDGAWNQNSYSVVYAYHVDSQTAIDGFTIRDGSADNNFANSGGYKNSGGGIFADGNDSLSTAGLQILNCQITNNFAFGNGGGVYYLASNYGTATPVLTNCIFKENHAFAGAGLCARVAFYGTANVAITNCDFIDNQADNNSSSDAGAIIWNAEQHGVINGFVSGCNFLTNGAADHGGAVGLNLSSFGTSNVNWTHCLFDGNVSHTGGAIDCDAIFGGDFADVFRNCLFQNQESDSEGGCIFVNASLGGKGNYSVLQCDFLDNHAGYAGAGLFNSGIEGECSPIIKNSRFLNNTTDTYGAAIYNLGKSGIASPLIENCVFAGNSSISAGAIYSLGSVNGQGNPIIRHCSFYDNHASIAGGAIYCNGGEGAESGTSSALITNCVFWGNTAANGLGNVLRNVNGSPTISYCLVDVAIADSLNNGPQANVTIGAGMLYNTDPLFLNTAMQDLHVSSTSPAVNSGSNLAAADITVDLDSFSRNYAGTVDMGAYEYSPAILLPYLVSQPAAEFSLCEGQTLTLSVTAGGSGPLTYTWKKNNVAIGAPNTANLVVSGISVSQGGSYTCTVGDANNENVVVSESCIVAVTANVSPSLSIIVSNLLPCVGESVIINSQPINGGSNPVFNWYVNNVLVGSAVSSWTLEADAEPLSVNATFLSNAACLNTTQPVASPTLTLTGQDVVTPTVTISASTVSVPATGNINFTSISGGGGVTPSYQWFLNDVAVAGATNATWSNSSWTDGDIVVCLLESSSICATVNNAQSNQLTVNVTTTANELQQNLFTVYPNPIGAEQTALQLNAPWKGEWQLYNALGRLIFENNHLQYSKTLNLPSALPAGIYFLRLGEARVRFMVK